MNGDVPSVVEHTNSAVSVSLILKVFGAIVATGGTVKEKALKTKQIQVTTQRQPQIITILYKSECNSLI